MGTHHKAYHNSFRRFSKLHIGLKLLLIGFVAFLFLSSTIVVLGMKGIFVANWVMRYDSTGNSKWFKPAPASTALPEIKPYTADAVVEQINKRRIEEGANALTVNDQLTNAANAKTEDMMSKNYFDYKGPDGKEWWTPIAEAGYNYDYSNIAIAQGYTFVNDVLDNWFSKEDIKKNMLNKIYKDIGVSVKSGNYQGADSTLVVVYLANKQQQNIRTTTTLQGKVTCTGPDGKTFITTAQECTDFNTKWGNLPKPTAPKSLPVQSKPSYPSYVSIACVTVYGTYASYGKDYNEASKYCIDLQQNALNLQKSVPTVYIPNNTYQPAPTTPPYPTDECNKIKSEWISFKEQFNASMMNNFNSSADGVIALEGYRQQYQSEYTNSGCYGTLSLF
ncbi:MAG: CAP domain-containing protein [Candidatus Levyibacteriota bacterium]